MINHPLIIRDLGLQDYQTIWQSMRDMVDTRNEKTLDEIWILEHPPIFTLGQNGKTEHLLNPGNIPVIHIDRGGQVTYHGPGQLVAYVLIDLKRLEFGVRQLVTALENAIIALLKSLDINAESNSNAPGVYVNGEKICSLGLRIRRGCSYHGLSFNVDMDLTPFQYINPCGQQGLVMTQLCALNSMIDKNHIKHLLITFLSEALGYKQYLVTRELRISPL